MICAMFLFGVFFAIGQNINYILDQVQRNQGIEVFIKNEATDEEVVALGEQIRKLEGVNQAKFKTKEEALDSMKESMQEYKDLLEGYEGQNNIFPASYVVTLTDLKLAEQVESQIAEMDNVKKITSSNNTINTLLKIANGAKLTIGVIFIILLVISITIIANTIRLSVYARRKEISIMKYVGATNGFIRWPFMVEGMVIGLIAAILTIVIVSGCYDLIIQKIAESNVLQTMGITLLNFSELVSSISLVYCVLGILVGLVGSSISMKKYLEV
jgi:cell division transport system permease protein